MLTVHWLHLTTAQLLNVHGADALDELRAQLDPSIVFTTGPDVPDDCEILVAGRMERVHLTASPRLHRVIIPFAGLPETTRQLLLEFPNLAVHNLHHNAAVTAEMALALLLAAAKFLLPVDRQFRQHDWTSRYQPTSVTLEGKTVLILGYGHIGQRVGRACEAFGMKVLGVRRNPTATQFGPGDLPRLLPQAHVLLITLPHTDETHELIGEKELALMPRGGLLVNVGRGPIADEGALYRALKDQHLAGAGLDVWWHYPKDVAERTQRQPSTFPFHELENVVMSPHRGGDSLETESQRMADVARLLNAAAWGESLPNRVNGVVGY